VVVALHRVPARPGAALTEPARRPRPVLDVRVGSATDGLAPVSVARRSLAAQPLHWAELALVVAAAIAADQLTKHIVASQLRLDEGVHVLGPFSVRHVENPGIAFGLFASATSLVILLTVVAVAWMLAYFARSGARHPVLPVALGLVIGGSVSNLLDRVRLGHVIDFLDPHFGPAFNLADSFIVVGVAILLGALLAADREPRRSRRADGHPAGS
jgi:signal peptidase II